MVTSRLNLLSSLVVVLGVPSAAWCDVTVVSQKATALASARAIELFGGLVDDNEEVTDDTLFETFSADLVVAASGFAANNLSCGESVANSADASVAFEATVTRAATGMSVTGSQRAAVNASVQDGCPFGSNTGSALARIDIDIEVTGQSEPLVLRMRQALTFSADSAFSDASDLGANVVFGMALFPGNPVSAVDAIVRETVTCSNNGFSTDGPGVCAPRPEYEIRQDLPPGRYTIRIQSGGSMRIRGDITANADFELTLGKLGCDLAWAETGTGGSFDDAANWSPAQAPEDDGAGCNNLLFNRDGVFTVFLQGVQAANRVTLKRGVMGLEGRNGGTLNLSNTTPADGVAGAGLDVGESGFLDITGATVNVAEAILGGLGGTDRARVRVSGATSSLLSRDLAAGGADRNLTVGLNAPATLEIFNGGTVSARQLAVGFDPPFVLAADPLNLVVVEGRSGTAPSFLTISDAAQIGRGAPGALRVLDGALLRAAQGAEFRVGGAAAAELTVRGTDPADETAGSSAEIGGRLSVSGNDLAGLFVLEGARLSADELVLGLNGAPGSAEVSQGGQASITTRTVVGGNHDGRLDVRAGGRLNTGLLEVGSGSPGIGLLTVGPAEGRNTFIQASSVVVGSGAGQARVELTTGGRIECTTLDVPFRDSDDARGTVTLDATRLQIAGEASIGARGAGTMFLVNQSRFIADAAVEVGTRGLLSVGRGSRIEAPRVRVTAAGGRVLGARQRGKQADPGPAVITGDLVLVPGALLELEVEPGAGPVLRVEGDLEAAGTVEVRFPEELPLNPNDVADLFEVVGTTSGAFDRFSFPDRTANFEGEIRFEDGQAQVRVIEPGQPAGGEGEGEGENEPEPVTGCGGCDGKIMPLEKRVGDWIVSFFAGAMFLGISYLFRRRSAFALPQSPFSRASRIARDPYRPLREHHIRPPVEGQLLLEDFAYEGIPES